VKNERINTQTIRPITISPVTCATGCKCSILPIFCVYFYKGTKKISKKQVFYFLFLFTIFISMKKDTTKLNITLSTELVDKIKEGNYNRNKLIISLLQDYSKKIKK